MSNLTLITEPAKWSSLHRGIDYVLHHYDVAFSAVVSNGGLAKVTHSNFLTYIVGDEVYLSGTIYNGRYTITTVHDSTHVTINATYSATDTGGIGRITNVSDIYISAGYPIGHTFYATKPDAIVSHIKCTAGADGIVTIDVSEYIKSAFEVKPPTDGFDYYMSIPFHIGMDVVGSMGSNRYAVNGTLPHTDLLGLQMPGKVLSEGSFVAFGNGCYIVSSIIDNAIYNQITCETTGTLPGAGVGYMDIQNPFIVS